MVTWPKVHVSWVLLKATVPNGPWWYSRCNMCPNFFPGCCSVVHRCSHKALVLNASVVRGRPESSLLVWKYSTNHCWKHWHTNDTLCATCAAVRRYIHPASLRPTVRPLKLFYRSTYSSSGHGCTLEWMLQSLFTSESTTFTLCRVKTEGAKTGLLSAIWSPMTVTNESLTLCNPPACTN